MKVATAEQMRGLDRRAAEDLGVPSIVLMENAGRHVFEAAREILGCPSGRRVTVVAGSGNNGGDGFVVARHLRDAGADVSVLLLADPAGIKGDAKTNLEVLVKTGIAPQPLVSADHARFTFAHSDLIVDAVFGTGLRGTVTGLPAEAIREINECAYPVIAVDIPSGLNADTGQVLGISVKADCTVTFALPKPGLVLHPGAEYVGRLVVGDIGIPKALFAEIPIETTEPEYVAGKLPKRGPTANKGTFGTAVVIAGAAGYTGAAAMAGESALRAGAGLSVLATPASLQDIMSVKLTEVITRGLPETPERTIASDALDAARQLVEKGDAVVLGCGLSTNPDTCEFVHAFVKAVAKPMIIDADGLNALAEDTSTLEREHGDIVITPHPGEMARLLKVGIPEVQADRIGAAQKAASLFRCVTVLKGARTLIAEPGGRVFINTTGNPGLATGGTGDVLAGLIGGLLAQGLSPLDAAVCGVHIHGKAGDIAASTVGTPGMIAGDVMRSLPAAFRSFSIGGTG